MRTSSPAPPRRTTDTPLTRVNTLGIEWQTYLLTVRAANQARSAERRKTERRAGVGSEAGYTHNLFSGEQLDCDTGEAGGDVVTTTLVSPGRLWTELNYQESY